MKLRVLVSLLAAVFAAVPAFAQPATDDRVLTGSVLDTSGAAIAGVTVVLRAPTGVAITTITDREGRFALTGVMPDASLSATADGFEPVTRPVRRGDRELRLTLRPSGVRENVTVTASGSSTPTTTGTRVPTPLRDVPQAISVISARDISDLGMQGMSDVIRYVPGVGVAQGESNRDQPVFRGSPSTGDFFVDGVRDDAQYFRDLYNVDRVEVLKGPNAMAFGRGGVGGVINRVTKQPDWTRVRELSLQGGSWSNRRLTADIGDALGGAAAFRVAGVFEDSGSYRANTSLERQGITPSFAFMLGLRTLARASVEYFHDRRTADRGVPSLNGRPLDTAASTFFGNPDLSYAEATVNIASMSVEHMLKNGIQIHNRTQLASYDKFYQNVFAGPVNAAAATVSESGYNHATDRGNVFNQTDVLVTGRLAGLTHRVATGLELGRQTSGNLRKTAYFTAGSGVVTTINAPLENPTTAQPAVFQPSATDADSRSVATIGAVYVQDQVRVAKVVELVAGLRYDRFQVDATSRRTGDRYESLDHLVSPRIGVVVKPTQPLSIYSGYTVAYQPRAGDQLTSLSLSNRTLEPEVFRNAEVGAKWDVRALSLTAAAYRLNRGNVAIASPDNPGVMLLVDGQRTKGLELGLSGRVTRAWNVLAAYAYQTGQILTTQSATIRAGASLGQVPRRSASVWNRYDITPRLGAGVGVVHRDQMFAAADNAVILPAFTRVDGALFVTFASRLRGQVNVENLLDSRYYAAANSNNNITPGAPRALRVTLVAGF
jgi:catecholate siderophore receptor